jgi:aspartyl-tRNA(Asn)/glutamyl-tRNA(Gln) amidotransferase subunit A
VTSGLTGLTASAIRERVARRDVSAEEVVRAHLERIATVEPAVDAFLALAAERALERARRLDRDLAGGAAAPALAGVPIAVKDILHVSGLATTCGSRILAGYHPAFEATVVTRLEAAGAIVLGKANMDEFAMGSSTEHSAFKATRNPWDRERVPGGSSGGSAAAVAARMVPLALGTDTGGSIRQPAALCGVCGLKPTWGRASRYGIVAFASSLDQVGPLARSVLDLAIASSVLCGHDPADATSSSRPVPDFARLLSRGASGLRLGVPRRFIAHGVETETLARFDEALGALQAAGASVVDVELKHLPHAIAAYYLVATAEASSNLARFDGVRYGARAEAAPDLRRLYGETRDLGFGAEVKRRILLGTFALSSGYYDAYYLRAQKVRTLIRRDFEQAFESCDAIATPTTPAPAFGFGEKTEDPLQMYLADIFTVPANLAGLPGLSLPCGLASGLPVGLQLVGRPFEEETLLRLGAGFQLATAHHELAPRL